jgi:hypothetical protein
MAQGAAAASGGSCVSVLPGSTSTIPYLSLQNSVQLAQQKKEQGVMNYFQNKPIKFIITQSIFSPNPNFLIWQFAFDDNCLTNLFFFSFSAG